MRRRNGEWGMGGRGKEQGRTAANLLARAIVVVVACGCGSGQGDEGEDGG
jgi:hypothetical protein